MAKITNKKYLKTYDRSKNKGLNEVSKKVMQIMKERGITNYQIEKATGIYAATLENAFNLKGSWKTAVSLMKIADFLKVDINELLPGDRIKYSKEKTDRIKVLEEKNEELRQIIREKEEAIKNIRNMLK
jgi:transcriptional regulator with XRE-family HTH domain